MTPGASRLGAIDRVRALETAAAKLGLSRGALDVYASSDVIDLHIESFIWTRIAGYDLSKRHGRGLFGARFYSQVDLPRLRDAGLTGAVFSIATWPFRTRRGRARALHGNVSTLRKALSRNPETFTIVDDYSGYVRARAEGKVGLWIAVQGGNALEALAESSGTERDEVSARSRAFGAIPDHVSRVTLVHLTRSSLGGSSAPGGGGGLTPLGREVIVALNRRRILVDLAHISRAGFWDAIEVHDRSQPLLVSHSGVCGVTPHWRNLEDDQIKAIAETGGVIGVIFHSAFLGDPFLGGRASSIVAHMEHIIAVAGDDFVALGSDWDGLICTPRDMPTVLELPVLVERMLARGWKADRIRKILGENHLRVMRAIRP